MNWPTDKPGKISNLDMHTETDNGQAQDKLGKASISPTPLRPIVQPEASTEVLCSEKRDGGAGKVA